MADENGATIEVEDPGAPHLHEEPGPPPPMEEDQEQAHAPGWTEEQASRFTAGLAYAGLMLFFMSRHGRLPSPEEVAALAVEPREVTQTATAITPLLDRFLPVSGVGGVAAAGVAMIAIPAELGAMVMRRQDRDVIGPDGRVIGKAPLLRKPPAPRDVTREATTTAPSEQEPVANPPTGADGGSFHLDPRAAAVAARNGNDLSGSDL